MSDLTYDAVIATRNRPEALALSVPLLIGQSRPPSRLIVIDASDDPEVTHQVVAEVTAGWRGETIVRTSAAGLPSQRNCGLKHVTAPVVMFPDDDSLLFPDAAARIMAIYDRDRSGRIAAVAGAESRVPPSGTLGGADYEVSAAHRREAALRGWRHRLERNVLSLKPAIALGRSLNARNPVPSWLAAANAVPVEYMTGYRMSFRTDAIRASGFDEALCGYAVDEDIDASFTAMQAGLVVAARSARIYHHRYPSGRGDARLRGRMEVVNRAYVLLKHATGPYGSAAMTSATWRRHLIFTALKFVHLVPTAMIDRTARLRMAGAFDGHAEALRLWRAEARTRPRLLGPVN